MEDNLISKKDLLQRYGISYGALYRWKRKGLIPEEWFLKKSTVTGQETFFDEKTICERIELIIAQKEDTALDELAVRLAPPKEESGIVIVTAAGSRTFRPGEIKGIFAEDGCGNRRNITKRVLELLSDTEQE